jgi:L-rhamnose isomerase
LLLALLEPAGNLRELESAGDYTSRLAVLEELKSLPWGAVWAEHCRRYETPVDREWMTEIKTYEKDILSRRR